MQKNEIILPGISNARELGGYPAGDKYIKKKVLIRSGSLSGALPEAVQILQDTYKLKHIVDFRMKNKNEKEPDPAISGAVYTSVSAIEIEDFFSSLSDSKIAGQFSSGSMDIETVYKMAFERGLLGPELYVRFLLGERGKKAYQSFFKILADHNPDDGAVLWHCDDGKDRAGIATMLLLFFLGADRDTIVADYLMTNESNAQKIEAARQKFEAMGLDGDGLDAMIFVSGGVFAKYIEYAIETLDKKYGSVTGYIREELGFSDSDKKLFREKYLM
ncbi:tyrosine-protein phosphatase [Butyrivibrio sp. JL13D10]|uniref:tyrosine-protein phosphatase n=1 Tax=Butyrivibrio sp. JL13D10 TaxID=3236815 RepID=UPI0038B6303D